MATNFDATRLAVQTAFPTNDLLFDDKEMPSIHVFIPKFRLCDVLSTQSTETHPAFIVNGKEIDGALQSAAELSSRYIQDRNLHRHWPRIQPARRRSHRVPSA